MRPVGWVVVAMETKMSKCTAMETKLANLLLDPSAASAEVKQHVAGCDDCRREQRRDGREDQTFHGGPESIALS